MKFFMYGRTPRTKTPKWITVFLISLFAFFIVFFFVVGIVISIDIQSLYPALIIFGSIAVATFFVIPMLYNMNHAYIEIQNETIKIIEYPFFKKRERIVLLSDIKKAKWRAGGRGRLPQLVFKNDKNKNLFHLDYVPEVISYFEGLGIKIQC